METQMACRAAPNVTEGHALPPQTHTSLIQDITTLRNWISSGTFPDCVQDFAPASYELKSYWIGRKSLNLDTEDVLWRTRSATGGSFVSVRHHIQ